jgi:long-chain acyl-CoA synthetase
MEFAGKLTFPELFDYTLRRFGNRGALAFAGEEAKSYNEIHAAIASVTGFLEKSGISKGDRVAILSSNMPNWAIAYFGITFMGAVAVPILPDFSPAEVANVLEHSGTGTIFVSSGLLSKISKSLLPDVKTVILTEDFSTVRGSGIIYDPYAVPSKKYHVDEDDLAAIIYTSGTTGKSKGVMLTHKNISFNAIKGREIQPINEHDRFLSVLPLSHTYENTLGLILPMISGACVYYLRKPPSPAVLLPALSAVMPTIMLTAPLAPRIIFLSLPFM